jgi:hypothetical protein
MPNWVYNSLTIEGNEEDIAKVKAQLNKPFVKQHDQWNSETNQMEVKDYSYSNPVFAFHNIYNHIEAGISNEDYIKQPDHTLPIQEAMMFKGNHWYDFNVREWGTKWDVGMSDDEKYRETELMIDSKYTLAYRFNTAWSPPAPAIEKLSAQYPELEFTLSFEEETGWGGETIFNNGNGIETEVYGWKCKECDHIKEDTPYCEECDFDTCPSCGYNEADEACEQHREGHNAHLLN